MIADPTPIAADERVNVMHLRIIATVTIGTINSLYAFIGGNRRSGLSAYIGGHSL